MKDKKDYGKKGQIIKAELNPATGQAKFWQVKLVVDPSMILTEEEFQERKEEGVEESSFIEATEGKEKIRFNPEKHILLKDAKKIKTYLKENKISLKKEKDLIKLAGYITTL